MITSAAVANSSLFTFHSQVHSNRFQMHLNAFQVRLTSMPFQLKFFTLHSSLFSLHFQRCKGTTFPLRFTNVPRIFFVRKEIRIIRRLGSAAWLVQELWPRARLCRFLALRRCSGASRRSCKELTITSRRDSRCEVFLFANVALRIVSKNRRFLQ